MSWLWIAFTAALFYYLGQTRIAIQTVAVQTDWNAI